MVAIEASGTQVCVIGSEHTLITSSSPRSFVVVLDLSTLQSGDTIELRMKRKVLTGSVIRVAYKQTVSGAQSSDAQIWTSLPMPSTIQFQASIKQTAGVGRSVEYSIESV